MDGQPMEEHKYDNTSTPYGREMLTEKQTLDPNEFLRQWDINIKILNRGAIVTVGCKSFAFNDTITALEEVKRYIQDPLKVSKEYSY